MKKILCLMLTVFFCLGLVACGETKEVAKKSRGNGGVGFTDLTSDNSQNSSPADSNTASKTEEKTTSKTVSSTTSEKPKTSAPTSKPETAKKSDKIDFDISNFNFTMAFSQISEMKQNKSKYLGKRIKVKGIFEGEEAPSRNYYYCIVKDTTACCSEVLEFVLRDTSLTYPKDYPKSQSEIVVDGIFHSYKEGTDEFFELTDAVISK
ncbi:MAG: hypothetical protein MJ090_03685 [Clostridia bacterium]|nr:hypothetical protein [Clostridia bacterium]